MLKKLFSHTAIYGLAPQVTKVASFFALPLITKDLTSLDYGVSGILTAYTTAISVFAALGLRLVLVNSFFKSPGHYKWLWRQVYGFLTLWNFAYALILSGLIYWAIPKEAIDNKWTILFLNVAPLIFFGQTSTLGSTYYQINQKPFQVAFRSAFFGVATIGLNVFFISNLKMGYMGWFWSSFIVGMANNLSYYYPLNFILKITPIFNFKRRLIRQSLKVSLPTIPHYYSGYLLNSSDRAIMDMLKVNTNDIGKYNVAYTVGRFIESLGTASGLAVGPILNKFYKAGNDEAGKNVIFILQITFFVITFCIAIWMNEIFRFLIRNAELAKMYPLGIIIMMSYNYRPMYFGANAKLMYAEKTNVLWKVTFMAGLISVVLNIALLPFLGFEVAAYSTFVSLMYMGYAGFYFRVFREINAVNYYPLLWLTATVVLTALAYWLVEAMLWIKIVVTLVAGASGLLAILKLSSTFKNE